MLRRIGFVLFFVPLCVAAEVKTLVRISGQNATAPTSFQQNGTGLFRDHSSIALSQAIVDVSTPVFFDWQVHGVVNGYSDGERKAGLSQLFAQYRPLSASLIKSTIKLGAFYPALSVENTDIGWLSPNFLSNSSINSWIGEELRVGGAEFSLRRPGRQARSAFSWSLHGAVFKGNDTTGTLLSWRGFALHDRQSVLNDRVNFAPWPAVTLPQTLNAPAWTEPFREIDKKWGAYVGAHVAYLGQTEARYYWYDNRADPNALTQDRLYAWRTRFHSLSLRNRLSSNAVLFSQVLTGDTLMGDNAVNNDFHAAFVALSYQVNDQLNVSTRLDWFQVVDNDNTAQDFNQSQGESIAINTTYQLSPLFSLSFEWQYLNSDNANRLTLDQAVAQQENLFQTAVTFRF